MSFASGEGALRRIGFGTCKPDVAQAKTTARLYRFSVAGAAPPPAASAPLASAASMLSAPGGGAAARSSLLRIATASGARSPGADAVLESGKAPLTKS